MERQLLVPAIVAAGLVFLLQCSKGVNGLRTIFGTVPLFGLIGIAAFPNEFLGTGARDLLLIGPTYMALIIGRPSLGRRQLKGFPWWSIAVFVAIVIIQTFNPRTPFVVRIIGFRTWLSYIPLIFVAYDFSTSKETVRRLFSLYSLVAIPALTIGIIEAGFVATGKISALYPFYGRAGSTGFQFGAVLQVAGGGALHRVPSIFPSVTQYYLYTITVLVASLVGTRLATTRSQRLRGRTVVVFAVAAALSCGAREALAAIPMLFLLDLVISDRSSRFGSALRGFGLVSGSAVIGVVALSAVAGSSNANILRYLNRTVSIEYHQLILQGFAAAFRLTTWGLGAGADSTGARYTSDGASPTLFQQGFEPWYVKSLIELGVLGLIAVVAMAVTISISSVRLARLIIDPDLASAASILAAFIIWAFLWCIKSQYLDFEPLGLFMWCSAGVLLRLRTLQSLPSELDLRIPERAFVTASSVF